MNEGWICPRCNKVNAPDVKACDCKDIRDYFEELKEYFPKPIDPPFYPIHPDYPDWKYRPYWYYYPWYVYTTTTGGASDKYK